MIYLDPRVGSGELLPYFKPYDVPVEVMQLDFADACFWGNGHDGPIMIGVERKIITDLVSSMRSNRLSGHQLPGLFASYNAVIIVVEGIWQCGDTGEIQVPMGAGSWGPLRIGSSTVRYREVEHYIATLEHKRGVVVKQTSNKTQTAAFIVSRYKWWNDKEWAKHDADEAIYSAYDGQQATRRASFTRRTVGPVEQVAAQFPGVNKKAYEFGKVFRTVHELINADVKDLEKVEGIGKKGAARIYKFLRGE